MIYNMDVMDFLEAVPGGHYKTMFADPPDNLGLDYDGCGDRMPLNAYYGWVESWILRAMLKCDILWISYYYKHDLRISRMVSTILESRHPSWGWQKVMWTFSFGQYVSNGLTNGYRPMIVLSGPNASFDWNAVRVVSERMLLGDSRAAGMRIPNDVWDFPRVVGNSKERRTWCPTQHPEELMERIIKVCGTPFCDLFGGTGTSIRVGKKLGVDCVERSTKYAQLIGSENQVLVVTGF